MRYVWGADVGGTTTRVGVADRDGRVLVVVTAGPGNPHAVGITTSADRIRSAARQALRLAGAPDTAEGVIGLAGVTAVEPETFAALADPARDGPGERAGVGVRVVADLAVAFASGTPADEGIIVLAGTGAGAMVVRRGDTLERRNAWGWLLGDEGSAQWIGREAVRSTLTRLERDPGPPPTDRLSRDVLETFGVPPAVPELIRAVYAHPPTGLAALAPLVDTAARAGDADARAILDSAARHVTSYAVDLAAERPSAPVVLSGSLLAPGGPLAGRVRAALAGGAHTLSDAADGVAGACWLALSATTAPTAVIHRRLVATTASAPRHALPA